MSRGSWETVRHFAPMETEIWKPGENLIKTFFSSPLAKWQDEIERLSLCNLFSRVWCLRVRTGAYHRKVNQSNCCSKYWTRGRFVEQRLMLSLHFRCDQIYKYERYAFGHILLCCLHVQQTHLRLQRLPRDKRSSSFCHVVMKRRWKKSLITPSADRVCSTAGKVWRLHPVTKLQNLFLASPLPLNQNKL